MKKTRSRTKKFKLLQKPFLKRLFKSRHNLSRLPKTRTNLILANLLLIKPTNGESTLTSKKLSKEKDLRSRKSSSRSLNSALGTRMTQIHPLHHHLNGIHRISMHLNDYYI